MRRTDGQTHDADSRFPHSCPPGAAGHDLEPQWEGGPGGDPADGDAPAWEAAWVDLGGEG